MFYTTEEKSPLGVKLRRKKPRYPVGAGEVWSGEGTPCVVRRPRPGPVRVFPPSPRATQASPLLIHTAPASTGQPIFLVFPVLFSSLDAYRAIPCGRPGPYLVGGVDLATFA
jgi:hypothetical protein